LVTCVGKRRDRERCGREALGAGSIYSKCEQFLRCQRESEQFKPTHSNPSDRTNYKEKSQPTNSRWRQIKMEARLRVSRLDPSLLRPLALPGG
jgi:hypothetical protein